MYDMFEVQNSSDMLAGFTFRRKTDMTPVTIVLIVLYIASFIIGLLGNLFLIIIVGKTAQLRNATNFFLCNMAVSDLSGKHYLRLLSVMNTGSGRSSLTRRFSFFFPNK